MRRIFGLIALGSIVSGCTLLFVPDPPEPWDAGLDGEVPDAMVDAGPDAGDGGCVAVAEFERRCDDGVDDDCNGNVDCADLACGASGHCCDPESGGELDLPGYLSWPAFGSVTRTDTTVAFADSSSSQVLLDSCLPLAYGTSLRVGIRFASGGVQTEHAGILLSPVRAPGPDGTFLSEVSLRVDHEGTATLDRAGTPIGDRVTSLRIGTHVARMDLRPGLDSMARPVLLLDASISDMPLVENYELMPLDDLRGAEAGCSPDGLFVVLEGRGDRVTIADRLRVFAGECDNPSQFDADQPTSPLASFDPSVHLAAGTWRAGGVGEPALAHFYSSATTERLDILVDAAATQRADELLAFVDFGIGGAFQAAAGGFIQRTDGTSPVLLGDSPSSREPSLFAPVNASEVIQGNLLLAHAERIRPMMEPHAIHIADLGLGNTDDPSPTLILAPGEIPCASLRDPSIIALSSNPRDTEAGLVVFFTCEPSGVEPDYIAAARVVWDGVSAYTRTGPVFRVLESSIGDYAARGVSSPEVVVTSVGGEISRIRVWFLARDGSGRVRVAFATGTVSTTDLTAAPMLTAFPGNPVLDPEDAVLGGPCALGCSIESLGVARTVGAVHWPVPSYAFLVQRTRYVAGGVEHQLIPLSQRRPAME